MENKDIDPKTGNNLNIPTLEFYSQIIDSLQDYSIFTLNIELKINSWSAGSTKLFGYNPEEVMGKPFDIIFSEEDLKNDIPNREIEIASTEGRSIDNRWHITKDKGLFFSSGLVFPLISVDGNVLGYVVILRDLTDKKKLEDSIKKYVKELEVLHSHKESVLAILSHDLRSPLTSIIGIANYLKISLDTIEQNELKDFLEIIETSSRNELSTLDYLLEWARIKCATDVFSPTPLKLREFIDIVYKKLKGTASINDITLYNEIEENTSVFADGKMLISIIQNLVSNSIKHTGKGGTVTISAINSDSNIIIEVKDTGTGMSNETQEQLFKPHLKKLSKARNEKKGAGIGLILVKGFLEKNGGKIWVDSIEGKGSSFYFSLPIEEPESIIDNVDDNIFHDSDP